MRIASTSRTREIIEKHDFLLKKKYGQNFLIDEHILDKIITASDISINDVVIEVGPGIGGLTEELAKLAYKVIAIEIDKKLIPILNETLKDYNNIEIINKDILKVDINEIIDKYPDKTIKVVANLPYYITTPIVMGLLEERYRLKSITVMVQKEVADRMQAKPGTKDYGALSVAVQYYSNPCLVANVPKNCFIPRPNVDSAVIRLDIYEKIMINVCDESLMFSLIKSVFGQRRKTLLNCMYNLGGFNLDKEKLTFIIEDAGFKKEVRGETFSIEDFSKLTRSVYNYLKEK